MFEITRYQAPLAEEWNRFVERAKNATFLFDRHYMDYHADRFADASLLFYKDGSLQAVLPANADGDTLWSHQGLTYGGLLTTEAMTTQATQVLFAELNDYLRGAGFRRVAYKCVPWIYHRVPAEEDLYALFATCHARLVARDVASVVDRRQPVKWRRDRRYAANKAHTDQLCVSESDDLEAFWRILDDNLMARYGVHPVHTLQEMRLLKARFPQHIRLFMATRDGQALGGTLLYITPQVVHAQYISATPEGKHLHAIDLLYRHIIQEAFPHQPYVDFGKSTEQQGHVLNETLIYQKEGFGGRAVCYDWYEWELH